MVSDDRTDALGYTIGSGLTAQAINQQLKSEWYSNSNILTGGSSSSLGNVFGVAYGGTKSQKFKEQLEAAHEKKEPEGLTNTEKQLLLVEEEL